MNEDSRKAWANEVLALIFEALAAHRNLRGVLVFKGAQVLHRRLGSAYRKSYDIDANLTQDFIARFPDREDQRAAIETEFASAIDRFFEAQPVVRYKLLQVRAKDSPPKGHPRGWHAFEVNLRVEDLSKPGTLGLPALVIDVAAPEPLTAASTETLAVGKSTILAYTLQRIAGEKCRAFLSSLPAYRAKLSKPGDVVRAKDLYDLSRILMERPIADERFWRKAGAEFRLACESRLIDCAGLVTFQEELEVTAATYRDDASIPKDVSFEQAWEALNTVVRFFEREQIIPFTFPIPGAGPPPTKP